MPMGEIKWSPDKTHGTKIKQPLKIGTKITSGIGDNTQPRRALLVLAFIGRLNKILRS